ncbi:MAG: hypothetical protein AAF224_09440 [Pseudomonadota bacterium]
MFGFRILLFIVAYVVVLAEMIVGEGASRPLQGAPWIVPGGLVIALLLASSNFILANFDAPPEQRQMPNAMHWIIMLTAGMMIAGTAFYFPNYISEWLKPMMME